MDRISAYWTYVESRRVGLISFVGENGLEAVKEIESETVKCFEEIVVKSALNWCDENKMDLRFVYEFTKLKEVDLHCMKCDDHILEGMF